jgi:hypothetical protein
MTELTGANHVAQDETIAGSASRAVSAGPHPALGGQSQDGGRPDALTTTGTKAVRGSSRSSAPISPALTPAMYESTRVRSGPQSCVAATPSDTSDTPSASFPSYLRISRASRAGPRHRRSLEYDASRGGRGGVGVHGATQFTRRAAAGITCPHARRGHPSVLTWPCPTARGTGVETCHEVSR